MDIDDDIQRHDGQVLFKDGEVTLELLLECLVDHKKESMLTIYDPDDLQGPDGRPSYTIYSVLRVSSQPSWSREMAQAMMTRTGMKMMISNCGWATIDS